MGIVIEIEWPNAGLSDRDISHAAQIDGSKIIRQQANSVEVYPELTSVADVTKTILMVYGKVGTLIALEASIFDEAGGDSTVTVELKKSTAGGDFGTVLTTPLSISASTVKRTQVNVVPSTTGLVAGDILQIAVTTAGSGTLPKGLLVTLTYQEAGKSA